MIKNIYKLILISLILPIHFSNAEPSEANLEKKYKIYGLIKDIKEELNNFEHSKEQVSKSHKQLNKVLVTLTDDYGDEESQPTITISDGPLYDFGNIFPNAKKTKVFSIIKTGSEPVRNLVFERIYEPFQYVRYGEGNTCNSELITSDCTFSIETDVRFRGVFRDEIKLTYTHNGKIYTTTRKITARYR